MSRQMPGIVDVAKRAGVSTATVDRVLHGRPGVRQATVQRVLKAAGELGYLPEAEVFAGLAPPPARLTFVLPRNSSRFIRMLEEMVRYSEEYWAPFNVKCRTETVESFNPQALAATLLACGARCDGIVMMALEHPAVREAVNELADRNIPTVTLISDILNSRRVAYVGLDNRAAGRTAGHLIARFVTARPARVAMIAGSLSYRAHEERELGFLAYLGETAPDIEVLGLRETHDDEGESYRQMRMLLARHPDLAGVYIIGGGTGGVARALKEARRDREVVVVGHGLTPETRSLLIDGTMDAVLTQDPRATITGCAAIFANLRAGRDAMSGLVAPRIDVVFRENLP